MWERCSFECSLLREGRRFLLTTGHWQESGVRSKSSAASLPGVATSIRRLQLGIIGKPFEGMLDIRLDDDVLLHNGLNSAKSIPTFPVQKAFAEVSDEALSNEVSCMKRTFSCERLSENALGVGRLALALEKVVVSNQLDGGAVNCHSAGWRDNPKLGVLRCMWCRGSLAWYSFCVHWGFMYWTRNGHRRALERDRVLLRDRPTGLCQ